MPSGVTNFGRSCLQSPPNADTLRQEVLALCQFPRQTPQPTPALHPWAGLVEQIFIRGHSFEATDAEAAQHQG